MHLKPLEKYTIILLWITLGIKQYTVDACLPWSRDGGWSSWHPISWEDTPCCNGLLTRRRNCDDPCPAGNGAKCEGDSEDKKDCNECKRELDGCQHECLNYNHIKESPLTFKCYCDEGYRVSPADSKKCEKKECKRLSAPANGSITPSICESNPRHEDACFRTCDRGYEPIGPEYVECTDGKWSDTNVFQCRVRKCQALSELDNGKITPAICNEQPLHGRTCVYECDPGYKVKGHNSNICDDGHWRFSFSTCEDVEDPSFGKTCPSEPESYIAEEGRITATLDLELIKPTATDNSGVVRLSSFPQVTSPHAFPEGITTLIYEAEDPSGNKARCFFKVSVQVLRCSVLPAPANGKFENGTCGNVYGSSCRFACNKGYKITGSVERKCVKKIGTDEVYWKGNETSCAIVRCFSLNTPANTMKAGLGCNDSRPRYNTNCFFRCNRGFEAEKGSERVTCKETGQWDGDPLQCKAITCKSLTIGSVEGLEVTPRSCINTNATIPYETLCLFACKYGYQLKGPGGKTCAQSKLLEPTGENPSCEDVSAPVFINCSNTIEVYADRGKTSTIVDWPHPTAIDNSGFDPNVILPDKQSGAEFSSGVHIIIYKAEDRRGNTAECKFKVIVSVIRCLPPLHNLLGGHVSCSLHDNRYGSNCSYVCHLGYKMVGSGHRVCEKNASTSVGFWTGLDTKCELVRCLRLPSPDHSLQHGCGGGPSDSYYGDKCSFHCIPGYRRVNGSTERICQANETWSGEEIKCNVVRCKSLKPPKDGDVKPSDCKNSPVYYTSCELNCPKGYILRGDPITTCTKDGTWSKNTSVTYCEDIESPSFGLTCPSDIHQYADKAKNHTNISWPPLVATDNSGIAPIVIITGKKSIYYEGKHEVVYNATDGAGNYKICKFYVTVEVLLCPNLPQPTNGFFFGKCGNIYGSKCRIRCIDGFNLHGSENISCLHRPGHLSGYWDNTASVCKVRSCDSLSDPQHGVIYPHMCKSYPVSGTLCEFECKPGYQHNGGVTEVHCGNDGEWNRTGSFLECSDVSPPEFIRCPSDLRVNINANSTALVNWTEPIAQDNSNVRPNITVTPAGISPPHRFNETTLVVYTATDANENTDECSFQVIIEDNEGPVVVYCPPDQHITATKMKMVVTWNEPQFEDNSNSPLVINCNRESGDEFYWGTWNVHCTAYDNNPNNDPAICQFKLIIKPTECPELNAPLNGAKACDDWMFGTFCTPSCNNESDFSQPLLSSIWVCGAKGTWNPTSFLPDCTKVFRPGETRMAVSLHYFYGDCNSPETQQQIKENFIKLLNESYFSAACQEEALRDKCKVENVVVTCGNVTRRRRSTDEDVPQRRHRRSIPQTEITLDIVVGLDKIKAEGTKESEVKVGEEGVQIAKKIGDEMKRAVDNGSLSLTINGTVLLPDKQSLEIKEPKPLCSNGQTLRGTYCLNCTAGTFLNKDTGKCDDCPIGTYQGLNAQEMCFTCPPNTSTFESRSVNISSCLGFCKPGSYSPTGLEPCTACEKGYYQVMEGQKTCSKCGDNETTSSVGCNSSTQCGIPCPAGSFSPNGLHPCTLCNRRSFQPRSESRACLVCPGTTVALKSGSMKGQDCIEIDECNSNPCNHNSTCIDLIGDFKCSCQPGYTGKQCEINIDDCQNQPCANNGTCHDLVNNHTCSCKYGFEGVNCESDIDECALSPCSNNASCKNFPGGFSCVCEPGYIGTLCNIDIYECSISPCKNGGICRDKINNYECICTLGYTGKNCEENIDDCRSDPCQNGGKCLDGIASYQCVCPPGLNGTRCEHNIDDCLSANCQNNASCLDQVNAFYCICQNGFTGKACEHEINECLSDPCKNQAKCVDKLDGYFCDCRDGFNGVNCENDIDDCAVNPCLNNGSCYDAINHFSCICSQGFTGEMCDVDIDYCVTVPCYNNGSCLDDVTSFTCICEGGFEGKQCEINVDECQTANCLNNSTCNDGINDYKCACPEGFVGIQCEINVNDCGENPCLNDGTCKDLINDYQCTCKRGYSGKNCSVNIDECASSPCQNNATCFDKVDNYTCACINGFSGPRCAVNVDDCLVNFCSNGSTCRDGLHSYSCDCAPGFFGEYCDMEINECASFPCLHGGECKDQIDGFVCICSTGFSGAQCEKNIDECASSPCENNGTCLDRVANYSCQCPKGFNGSHCENRIDYCKISNCTQNGHCVNSLTGFICNCNSGYYGRYCDLEIDECLTKPCFNSATCRDAVNNFTCSCADGYTGKLCEKNINDCVNNSCLNNATCMDLTLGYRCLCADGYNGTFCETEIDECESNPCINNGTCVNLTPGYNCKCLDQFYGENCENLLDLCISSPCQNGGTCKNYNSIGGINCSCRVGFTGSRCEVDIDDCASNPCMANAYCIDEANSYSCECFPSYSGDHCDIFLGSNFDLVFQRKSVDDMVLLSDGTDTPSMRHLTIAMFVQANKQYKSGTLFTYSVPGKPNEIIVISFIESHVDFLIKDKVVRTRFTLADDQWHFFGVVWDGLAGYVSVFIDGLEMTRETGIYTNETVRGGGWIALGQHYLADDNSPSVSTAFFGTMHQVNIWNAPSTALHMWNAAHNCTWLITGSLRAWNSFLPGIKGQVQTRFKTQCRGLTTCKTNCSHFHQCDPVPGYYRCTCEKGFTGNHCNMNIDDCNPNPCVHGKCVDGVDSFECTCETGYWGTFCEKRVTVQKECPLLSQPSRGKKNCKTFSGKMLCTMSCDEGHSFSAEAITTYACGPDTEWKWNGFDNVSTSVCLNKAKPQEIEHHFSVRFPGIQCKNIGSHNELRLAVEREISDTLTIIPGCEACQLKTLSVPGCDLTPNRKRKRSAHHSVKVQFSLVVKEAVNASSSMDSVDENSEALLFQMQYVVAVGQFMINLHGNNFTADRSSFEHISSSITCGAGYMETKSGKECVACPEGTFRDSNSVHCNQCEKGSYQDQVGQANCKTCLEGKTTKGAGATSNNDCYKEKSVFTKTKVESDDNAVIYYIAASVVGAVILLLLIIGWCRLRESFCFTKPVLTNKSRSYRQDNKVSAMSHYNQAYGENSFDKKHNKPQSDKEQEPIYCEVENGTKTDANPKSGGLQKHENPLKEKYNRPLSGKEQARICSEVTNEIDTYASLTPTGLQKRDSSHYERLCYAPNSGSHYQNVPPYTS